MSCSRDLRGPLARTTCCQWCFCCWDYQGRDYTAFCSQFWRAPWRKTVWLSSFLPFPFYLTSSGMKYFFCGWIQAKSLCLPLAVAKLGISADLLGTGESVHEDESVCPMSFGLQTSTGPALIWSCLLCTAPAMLSLLVAPCSSLAQPLQPAQGLWWCPCAWELPLQQCCDFSMTVHPFTSLNCGGEGRRGCTSLWERAALDTEGTSDSGDGEYYHKSTGMKRRLVLHGDGVCISLCCYD